MIPYVIIMVSGCCIPLNDIASADPYPQYIGNIVAAVGMERKWPWQAIVVISFGAAGLQVAAIPAIVSTYAVDSYKPCAGSLFVVSILIFDF